MPNAQGLPTLLDIAKRNGSDPVVGLIEEAIVATPEVTMGFARSIKGINYKARVRTAYPKVGFRGANEGTAVTSSSYEQRMYECGILNPIWECDQAVADQSEDGAQAFIAEEGIGQTQGAMITLGTQFYYGLNADGKGFPGLMDVVDASMVVNAGGTTASTGSSVWFVKFGPQHVGWLWGVNGELKLSPVSTRQKDSTVDGVSKVLTVYHQEMLARPGLQVGHLKSVARIKNLTKDANKGLTDALLGQTYNLFPLAFKPDVIFMTKRSREQLRASRTATNPTGAPAPTPTDWEGTPIVATESLVDTEAIS